MYAARGMNVRLTLPSSSHGGKMNRPNSASTWPIVMPFSSPPTLSWIRYGELWRWPSMSAYQGATEGEVSIVTFEEMD